MRVLHTTGPYLWNKVYQESPQTVAANTKVLAASGLGFSDEGKELFTHCSTKLWVGVDDITSIAGASLVGLLALSLVVSASYYGVLRAQTSLLPPATPQAVSQARRSSWTVIIAIAFACAFLGAAAMIAWRTPNYKMTRNFGILITAYVLFAATLLCLCNGAVYASAILPLRLRQR
jgi:hypothetical protein